MKSCLVPSPSDHQGNNQAEGFPSLLHTPIITLREKCCCQNPLIGIQNPQKTPKGKRQGQWQQRWPWGESFSTSGLGGEDKISTYRSHRLERMIVIPRVGTFLPWHSRALHCFPSFCLLGFSFFLVPPSYTETPSDISAVKGY